MARPLDVDGARRNRPVVGDRLKCAVDADAASPLLGDGGLGIWKGGCEANMAAWHHHTRGQCQFHATLPSFYNTRDCSPILPGLDGWFGKRRQTRCAEWRCR